ncbi:hypothetical protein BOO69_16025 [Sulfitobacter alexandrii]|uniref:Peptidase S8/S53 domain-containing protein n=1 Tax=Sulfitobacter alexandrii TaxID=1917485 RepID=A0A1J0WKB7_9RHOB|nr:S8 family serine peptidase [Sulfitobacter alexandrii]APE44747.1 hypothetical protein BOO69_16025 [Sulfitobacter alexandrii]
MVENTQDYFWDGYLHWADLMDEAVDGPAPSLGRVASGTPMAVYEPVFVRLRRPLLSASKGRVAEMQQGAVPCDSAGILALPEVGFLSGSDLAFDLDDLLIGLEHALVANAPLEFFLYRPIARSMAAHHRHDALFEVIDVGAPVLLRNGPAPFMQAGQASRADTLDSPVIGAVIDNDIGFLNSTFRHRAGPNAGETRFEAIWLQSRECLASTPFPPVNAVQLGRFLRKPEIDAMIRDDPRDEMRIYQDINEALHVWDPFRRAPPAHTHGTAVADLAFGQDNCATPDGCSVPLMAVQLPPEAAVDTTGSYSESFIVQGVRWLCAEARRRAPRSRLVINISYGVLAGQKDGGKFLEAQVAREVSLAEALGQEVHVVYAYGNSLNSQQVARLSVPPGAASEPLVWVVQPDDPVPNFLEIRALRNTGVPRLASLPEGLEVTLLSPDGREAIRASPPPGAAVPPLGPHRTGAAARLYHAPERAFAGRADTLGFYNLAIAPTRRIDSNLPVAPAGDWRLSITNTTDDTVDLVLQIQRGDIAPGFAIGGRQSYFEGIGVPVVIDGHPGRDVLEPLTNEGTCSAFACATHPRIHAVGAQKDVLGEITEATYAARGAPWAGAGAATHHRVVDQVFTYGVRASGTYSGTGTRLSGSSGAAARLSRELVRPQTPSG